MRDDLLVPGLCNMFSAVTEAAATERGNP